MSRPGFFITSSILCLLLAGCVAPSGVDRRHSASAGQGAGATAQTEAQALEQALDRNPIFAGFAWRPLGIDYPMVDRRRDDIAVIIGNGDYRRQGTDLPNVVPAYADAESFFRYATATLGVSPRNVIDLRDATAAQLIRLFGSETNPRGQLADWVKPGTDVTVYYSGHGAPGPKGEGSYLVPVDAEATRIELGGYRLATLYKNLGQLPARRVTVVLEACFSGLSEGGSLIPAASGIVVTPKAARVPPKLTVISAGAADQIASWASDRTSGLFTKHYLTGMTGAADRRAMATGGYPRGRSRLISMSI